ncbi:MAG TPA: hypothetical protein VLZ82_06150 [Microbacterium sp.]|jgi:hypothetical protein|nr:hypothetical protein [Microbacterium sp.]
MRQARYQRRLGLQVTACSIAVFTALTLSGCANPIEKLVGQALSGSTSETTNEGKGKGLSDGVLPGVGHEVPDDFPDSVPLPDRKPSTVVRGTDDGITTWALHYQEPDGPAGFEALGQELIERGFVQESDTAMGDQMRIGLYVDDDHTVSITLLGDKGDQVMQVIVMEQADE